LLEIPASSSLKGVSYLVTGWISAEGKLLRVVISMWGNPLVKQLRLERRAEGD
jgi:hypothetical protein